MQVCMIKSTGTRVTSPEQCTTQQQPHLHQQLGSLCRARLHNTHTLVSVGGLEEQKFEPNKA